VERGLSVLGLCLPQYHAFACVGTGLNKWTHTLACHSGRPFAESICSGFHERMLGCFVTFTSAVSVPHKQRTERGSISEILCDEVHTSSYTLER